jgi:predicted amidohydrolase
MNQKIKLALAQISCKREDKQANLKKIEKLTFKAIEQGADLAVFPEMSLTGYVVRDQIYE